MIFSRPSNAPPQINRMLAVSYTHLLARTSSQPGKTQTINFYKVNGDLYLVDLPGYGYAKVSNEIKAKWGKMIERCV